MFYEVNIGGREVGEKVRHGKEQEVSRDRAKRGVRVEESRGAGFSVITGGVKVSGNYNSINGD